MKTLILLFLMTGVCWAKEPELVFSDTYNHHPILEVTNSSTNGVFDVDKSSIKFSCPDGYKLEGKMRDRTADRPCKVMSKQWKICMDAPTVTDAELKCTKDKQ